MITLNLIYISYQTITLDIIIIVYNHQSILYYKIVLIQRLEIK